MFIIILFLLCGISFAPLFISKLDMWHAQGIFAQIVLLTAFSWSFFEKPKYCVRNIPLGLLHLWIGISTAYICYYIQTKGEYDLKHFLVYFNFLCVLFLYRFIVQYLNRIQIQRIMNLLRYVVILTMIMCVLQRFHIAQFFQMFIDLPNAPEGYGSHNNPVFGFIGNGTHLSGFLASTIPLFLWHGKREDALSLGLMAIILFYTGTTLGDPAINGFIVALCVWFYWIKRDSFKIITTVGLLGFGLLLFHKYIPQTFLSSTGRFGIWEYYWSIFIKNKPITGLGLGTVNIIYQQTPYPSSRHVHMEYLQYAVELGVIGIIMIMNLINSFFNVKATDKTEMCLKACVLGFLISCCFNYTSHLWLPATWAVFFYASFIRIKGKDVIWAV